MASNTSLKRSLDGELSSHSEPDLAAKRQKFVDLVSKHRNNVDEILGEIKGGATTEDAWNGISDKKEIQGENALAPQVYTNPMAAVWNDRLIRNDNEVSGDNDDFGDESSTNSEEYTGFTSMKPLNLEVSSVLKHFQDDLQFQGAYAIICQVCEEIPDDPRVTQCAHLYCEECYSHLQRAAGLTDDAVEGTMDCKAEGCSKNIFKTLVLEQDDFSALLRIQGVSEEYKTQTFYADGPSNDSDDDGFDDKANRSDGYESDLGEDDSKTETTDEYDSTIEESNDSDQDAHPMSREEMEDLQDLFLRSYDRSHEQIAHAAESLDRAILSNFAKDDEEHEQSGGDNQGVWEDVISEDTDQALSDDDEDEEEWKDLPDADN